MGKTDNLQHELNLIHGRNAELTRTNTALNERIKELEAERDGLGAHLGEALYKIAELEG